MDEQSWLTSNDPVRMLRYLVGVEGEPSDEMSRLLGRRPSDRKLRLWACACAREHARTHQDYQPGFLMEAHGQDLLAACAVAEDVADGLRALPEQPRAAWIVWDEVAWRAAELEAAAPSPSPASRASLLREIVGNPFHRPTLCGAAANVAPWATNCPDCAAILTPTVKALAEAAYAERDSTTGHLDAGRLAVLADCLEQSGCTEQAILGHLRGPGPHVRGCAVIDLLTGRS